MANFGDILSGLGIGGGQAVRRNAGDSSFEAYTPGTIANGGTNASSFAVSNGVAYFNGTSLVNDADLTYNPITNRLTVGNALLATFDTHTLILGSTPSASLSGNNNTFIGIHAGISTTTGAQNTFIGDRAGQSNTTGYANTAVGDAALYSITVGNYGNVAVGASALISLTNGDDNICVGRSALAALTSNSRNVGIGARAGNSVNTGYDNTLIGGDYTGGLISSGIGNTCIGTRAGDNITTGSNNVAIGTDSDVDSATASNQTSINNTFVATASEARIHRSVTRLRFDGSNELAITVGSAGIVDYDALGSSARHRFNDDVYLVTGKNVVFDTSGAGTMIGTADDEKFAFHGATPITQDQGWSVSNYSTLRDLDATTATGLDVIDMLCTLVQKLIDKGIIGA